MERRRLAKWEHWYLDKGALDRLLSGRDPVPHTPATGHSGGRSRKAKAGPKVNAATAWTRPNSRALESFFRVDTERTDQVAVRVPRFVSGGSPHGSPKSAGGALRGAGPGSGGQQRLPPHLQLDSLAADGQRVFVVALHNELTKVNSFFLRRISELQKELHFLEAQVNQSLGNRARDLAHPDVRVYSEAHNPNSRLLRSTASLQRAVADMYRQCNDLDGFCLYNSLSALDVCTHIRMMRYSYQQQRKQQDVDALNRAVNDEQFAIDNPVPEPADDGKAAVASAAAAGSGEGKAPEPVLDLGRTQFLAAVTSAGANARSPVPAADLAGGSAAAAAATGGAGGASPVRDASNTVTSRGGDIAAALTTPEPNITMSPIVRRSSPSGADAKVPVASSSRAHSISINTSKAQGTGGAAGGSGGNNSDSNSNSSKESAFQFGGGDAKPKESELKVEHIIKGMLDRTEFFTRAPLHAMQQQIERVYASAFTDGRVADARTSLQGSVRPPYSWSAFGTGLRFGALLLLVMWVIWDCLLDARELSEEVTSNWTTRIVPVYRATGYWVVFYWLFGSMIWVTHKFRINLALLFDLPSDYRLDYRAVLHHATGISIVWCVNFLVHFKILLGQLPDDIIPEGCFPVALAFYLAYRTLVPWAPARFWLRVIWWTISAPFSHVTFVTVYVGDVLTSFTRPLNDAAFASCFFFSGYWTQYHMVSADTKSCAGNWTLSTVISPLMSALPLWFRFLQCLRRYYDTNARWPHLGNAGKYALSMTVALIGLTLPATSGGGVVDANSAAWLTLLILSTFYTFSWDVWMDWGLGAGCCKRTAACCHGTFGCHCPCGPAPQDDVSDKPSSSAVGVGVVNSGGNAVVQQPHTPYTPLPASPADDPMSAPLSGSGALHASASTPLLSADHSSGATPHVLTSNVTGDPFSVDDHHHSSMRDADECCGPCADSEACTSCAHDCYLCCGRNLQMFRARWPYYVAIALDLCLRFSWTLTLVPANAVHLLGPHLQLYLTPALGFAELFRRTAWSYLRLENEHLSRVQGIPTPDPTFIPKHILIPATTPGGGRSNEPLAGLDDRPNDPTATNGEDGEGDGIDDDTPAAALAAPRNVLIEVGVWAVLVIMAAVIIYLTRK